MTHHSSTPARRMRGVVPLLAALLPLHAAACTDGSAPEEPGLLAGAELSVLFMGNSLTYSNYLPDLVQTVAEAAGHTLARRVHAWPGYSLEDHWENGGEAVVLVTRADFVVLQQGPSSLPANQVHLSDWTARFAPAIREAGGEPALFMVWPERSRPEAFDAVRHSYLVAAEGVDGLFIPAGEAWREVWRRDPDLELYGSDGYHPHPLGSIVAALTIYAVISGDDVRNLPDVLEPTTPGLPTITLPAGVGPTIREAVFLVFAVMAVQYGSVVNPFVIILAIPLSAGARPPLAGEGAIATASAAAGPGGLAAPASRGASHPGRAFPGAAGAD